MILLDTHVLAWVDADDRKLGRRTRALVAREWEKVGVAVSAITFWEIGCLAERKRIKLPASPAAWREDWLSAGLVEIALEGESAIRSLDLAGLGPDPADRMIAATALACRATLVTADERLLDWKHALPRHDART